MAPDLGPFLALRRHLRVAHHVPGRIRLKLAGLALADLPKVDPAPLAAAFERIAGVGPVRVNRMALSAVVEYDPARIAMADWTGLLEGSAEEVAAILDRLSAAGAELNPERKRIHVA